MWVNNVNFMRVEHTFMKSKCVVCSLVALKLSKYSGFRDTANRKAAASQNALLFIY